jgi:hypothetical protein
MKKKVRRKSENRIIRKMKSILRRKEKKNCRRIKKGMWKKGDNNILIIYLTFFFALPKTK